MLNVAVQTQSSGGRDAEDIESIRAFAPKAVQVQERAITTSDYEILLKQNFPEIDSVAAYGGDVYLRSAADKQINLDADKGRSQINFYGSRVAVFCNKSVDFLIGPSNEDSTVNFAYSFNATSAILPVNLLVGGNITNYGDNKSIFTTGGVYAKGSIYEFNELILGYGCLLGEKPNGKE